MLRTFWGAAIAAVFVAGMASAQNVSRQVRVNEEFAEGSLGWIGLPGGYEYRINLIVVDGIIELCGVGAFSNSQARPAATGMLRGAKLKLNGQTILQDFWFFNRVNTARQLNNALANCRSTGTRVPRGEIDIDIDWPDGSFRN